MKKIIALSAIVIGLAGCSSSDDIVAEIGGELSHLLLNGTWVSNCVAEAPDSFKVVATLNDGIGSTQTTEFPDNLDCTINGAEKSAETFTYVFGTDVTLDGSVAGLTAATKVDSTDTLGNIDYDIFALDALITLYVGDTDGINDGSTDALRPTTLSSKISFTKQ